MKKILFSPQKDIEQVNFSADLRLLMKSHVVYIRSKSSQCVLRLGTRGYSYFLGITLDGKNHIVLSFDELKEHYTLIAQPMSDIVKEFNK